MTLTFKLDLVKVKMNQYAKYSCQLSFCPKVIVRTDRHTNTHAHSELIAQSGPLKWFIKVNICRQRQVEDPAARNRYKQTITTDKQGYQ